MTNEIENFDTAESDEVALTPAGKLAVFAVGILAGVGAGYIGKKAIQKLQARQAAKNAETEQE